jgi:hypothetical protein
MPQGKFVAALAAKDQIGTFTYFPSLALHRAAGGFSALNVYQRPAIPAPRWRLHAPRRGLVQGWPPAAQAEPRRRRHPAAARRPARQWRPVAAGVRRRQRWDVPIPRLQRRSQGLYQRPDPGIPAPAGGRWRGRTPCRTFTTPSTSTPASRARPAAAGLRLRVHALRPRQPHGGGHAALRRRHREGAWPATGRPAGEVRLVRQPSAVVPVEPHGQRGEAQPAGLLSLRRHPDVEDAGARELVTGPWRTEAVRGKRPVLRRPQARGQLRHRQCHRVGQPPGAARRRGAAARRVARRQAQPARVRRGRVPEHRE